MILKKMVKIINYLIPKKKIISFSSIPDYSDNSQAIFNYIIKNRTDKFTNILIACMAVVMGFTLSFLNIKSMYLQISIHAFYIILLS